MKTIVMLGLLFIGSTVSDPPLLGRLRSDPPGSAGCWAWPSARQEGRVVFSAPAGTGEIWVNIRGRDTRLTLAKGQDKDVQAESGRGVYIGGSFVLRADLEVDQPAPPEEECGHYTIKGTLTLEEHGKIKDTVRVNGSCGS